jgi:hypothetical protein
MFCSNDTDLNNYFKRQEAAEARYEHARAKALANMCYSELDAGEMFWAVQQYDKGLMTAEQVGLYLIKHRNNVLDEKIEKLL